MQGYELTHSLYKEHNFTISWLTPHIVYIGSNVAVSRDSFRQAEMLPERNLPICSLRLTTEVNFLKNVLQTNKEH